jgi:hypothetical protein
MILDTYTYQPHNDEKPNTDDENESVDFSSLVFRIKEIIYDPPGSDTGNEVIVIEYIQGPQPLQAKDFRLRVN